MWTLNRETNLPLDSLSDDLVLFPFMLSLNMNQFPQIPLNSSHYNV